MIADFADHNGVIGEDLYARTGTQPARLVAHGETAADGIDTHPTVRAISDDGRFVLYGLWRLDADSEPDDPRGDLRRTDLLRDRVSAVASSPLTALEGVAMNATGRRIAFHTTSADMIDDFRDNNGDEGNDVYAWFDKPPVADAAARITGPLALEFDGSGSSDSDGEIVSYRWDFGDGQGSDEIKPAHVYGDEDSYTVKLTIEDDGSNAVTYEFEVVAIKGVLTAGAQPLDFLGVDKNLRCSAVRGKELFAGGGGECGTFVALGGKVYGPPELIDGVTPYTPVRQDVSQDGEVAKIVTVVALGTTGVQVRQTDSYVAGTAWYRTDVALVNGGDATVYRAGHCVPGRPIADAGTAMGGCDVGGTRVALLPLTPGAHHEAGPAVLSHLGAGALPDDTISDTTDPAMMIGWRVKGGGSVGSLALFGPDGTIPLTVALKPDKDTVQPLDENGFVVTVRNANGVARAAGPIVADSTGAWDYNPGSTSGLTDRRPGLGQRPAHVGRLVADPRPRQGRAALRRDPPQRHADRDHHRDRRACRRRDVGRDRRPRRGQGRRRRASDRGLGAEHRDLRRPHGPDQRPRAGLPAGCLQGDRHPLRVPLRPGRLGAVRRRLPAGPARGPHVRARGARRRRVRRRRDARQADVHRRHRRAEHGDRLGAEEGHPRQPPGVRAARRRGRLALRVPAGRRRLVRAARRPTRRDALADGDHRFEARAIDAAGNPDPTPAVWTFRVDTTPPVTVIDGVTGRTVRPERRGVGVRRGLDARGRQRRRRGARGLLPGGRFGVLRRRRAGDGGPEGRHREGRAAPTRSRSRGRTSRRSPARP